jgi:hypothetical protein
LAIAGLTQARWIKLVEIVTAVMEHPGGPLAVGFAFPPGDFFPPAEPRRELAVPCRKVKRLTTQQNSIGTQQEFAGYEFAAEIVWQSSRTSRSWNTGGLSDILLYCSAEAWVSGRPERRR